MVLSLTTASAVAADNTPEWRNAAVNQQNREARRQFLCFRVGRPGEGRTESSLVALSVDGGHVAVLFCEEPSGCS